MGTHVGLFILILSDWKIGVYVTDVKMNCHAKNVMKYVGIMIFNDLNYHGYNMNYEI